MSVSPSRIESADVCLTIMPYAAIERPSIALSILKSVLTQAGISATVVYGNILFAEEIGVYTHDIAGKTQSHSLAGEWTFSSAAFPDFQSNEEAYFEHIGRGLLSLLPLVRGHGGRGQMPDILRAIRRRTPAFIDRLAQRIVASGPKIVGCSSTFQQHCASLALLRRIKELQPDITTVMGGANCESSMGLATHRECPWIDYVVSGEGENVFLQLCERLLGRGRAQGNHTGFAVLDDKAFLSDTVIGPEHRATNYQTLTKLPRAVVEDMSTSPTPDYDDYFEALRQSPVGLFVKPGLLIETSRGCWWGEVKHCTFCGLNGTTMGYRSKPPQRVLAEFDHLSTRYGSKTFEVVDNILDMSYFKSVLPQLKEQGSGFDIFYETKANLSRNHLQMLAGAGVRWLQPGIESMDDGLLKAIAKGTTTRQNLQLLKWSQDYGIYVLWILLYDIPGESDEAYRKMSEWFPLVAHLQPPSGISFIQYNRFSPYHQRPGDFNLTISPDKSYSFVYPWTRESLEQFAYFFDDYTAPRQTIDAGQLPVRPGLSKIYQVVSQWQREWLGQMNASSPPTRPARLIMRAENGKLFFTDSRACRVQGELVIEGLAASVYQICDQARTLDGVLRELERSGTRASREAVMEALEALSRLKILLALDGWYFGLATTGRLEPLNIMHYPGGRLRTVAEAEAAELVMYAEKQLNSLATPLT